MRQLRQSTAGWPPTKSATEEGVCQRKVIRIIDGHPLSAPGCPHQPNANKRFSLVDWFRVCNSPIPVTRLPMNCRPTARSTGIYRRVEIELRSQGAVKFVPSVAVCRLDHIDRALPPTRHSRLAYVNREGRESRAGDIDDRASCRVCRSRSQQTQGAVGVAGLAKIIMPPEFADHANRDIGSRNRPLPVPTYHPFRFWVPFGSHAIESCV